MILPEVRETNIHDLTLSGRATVYLCLFYALSKSFTNCIPYLELVLSLKSLPLFHVPSQSILKEMQGIVSLTKGAEFSMRLTIRTPGR